MQVNIHTRQALQELKERKEKGEQNLRHVDYRVVVRRPRAAWQPVVIRPRATDPLLFEL